MTDVTMNSTICDFIHEVHGKLEGTKIIIDIDSPCETIRQMSHLEVPIMDILDIKDNYAMEKAQEAGCCPNCIVPCGILHVCRIESGFLAGSLARKAGAVSIEFK